jgi:hypothetical protein
LEFKRVLKNNGKIILDFPNINNHKIYEFRKKSESVRTKVYLYNFEKIRRIIKKIGFIILKKQIRGIAIQLLIQRYH